MMNKDSLFYLEHMDAFAIMETHIIDRVMQEYWQSNLDASGGFMSSSTPYSILFNSGKFDYERHSRFYQPRVLKQGKQPHQMSFVVHTNSMQVRYFLEIFVFFTLAIAM